MGFPKTERTTIAIAVSEGVDSSTVTAAKFTPVCR
jgi:hypothetical protein